MSLLLIMLRTLALRVRSVQFSKKVQTVRATKLATVPALLLSGPVGPCQALLLVIVGHTLPSSSAISVSGNGTVPYTCICNMAPSQGVTYHGKPEQSYTGLF